VINLLFRTEAVADAVHGQDVPGVGWVVLDLLPELGDVLVQGAERESVIFRPERPFTPSQKKSYVYV